MPQGKGAMVWKLRDWKGGNPQAQAAQALDLGLKHISIKIVDGRQEKWEGSRPDQNADLLPGTINALRGVGIEATAWGWTYGGRFVWKSETRKWIHIKSEVIAAQEGKLAGELCKRYAIREFLIDAEAEYNKAGMAPVAEAYCVALETEAPSISHWLCSYRFPKTYQPQFPVDAFSPFMEGWTPQVYFLGDNRPLGGAIQLERSYDQYFNQIRSLPFVGVAPTYEARLRTGPWRATGEQLQHFFQKAVDLGHPGVNVWDLPQASPEQLLAIKNFNWPNGGTIPPPDQETIPFEGNLVSGKIHVKINH